MGKTKQTEYEIRATDVTADRQRGIGGSDISAIMGISAFTSRFELLQYKVGVKKNEFTGNDYTAFGNVMEGKIREYINSLGYDFHPDYVEIDDSDVLNSFYHADGVDHVQGIVLEVKTTSRIEDDPIGYKHYLVQLLYGMWLFGYNEGILAVYHRPDDMNEEFDKERLQIFSIGMEDYENLLSEIQKSINDYREDYKAMVEMPWIDDSSLYGKSDNGA